VNVATASASHCEGPLRIVVQSRGPQIEHQLSNRGARNPADALDDYIGQNLAPGDLPARGEHQSDRWIEMRTLGQHNLIRRGVRYCVRERRSGPAFHFSRLSVMTLAASGPESFPS